MDLLAFVWEVISGIWAASPPLRVPIPLASPSASATASDRLPAPSKRPFLKGLFVATRPDLANPHRGAVEPDTWNYLVDNFTEHNMGALGPTFDPAKRDKSLAERGLAFEDAALVFAGVTLDVQDTRAKAHRALP